MLRQRLAYPRHASGRFYARTLEVVGYGVAIVGTLSGLLATTRLGFAVGIGYVLSAIVSGITLVVLGELVIVFFNIEFNTSVLRDAASEWLGKRESQADDAERTVATEVYHEADHG